MRRLRRNAAPAQIPARTAGRAQRTASGISAIAKRHKPPAKEKAGDYRLVCAPTPLWHPVAPAWPTADFNRNGPLAAKRAIPVLHRRGNGWSVIKTATGQGVRGRMHVAASKAGQQPTRSSAQDTARLVACKLVCSLRLPRLGERIVAACRTWNLFGELPTLLDKGTVDRRKTVIFGSEPLNRCNQLPSLFFHRTESFIAFGGSPKCHRPSTRIPRNLQALFNEPVKSLDRQSVTGAEILDALDKIGMASNGRTHSAKPPKLFQLEG